MDTILTNDCILGECGIAEWRRLHRGCRLSALCAGGAVLAKAQQMRYCAAQEYGWAMKGEGVRMRPSMRLLAVSLTAVCALSACTAFGSTDARGTAQAEVQAFGQESTAIAQAAIAQGTAGMQTAVFARTEAAIVEGINVRLAETMRAVMPPTQQIVNSQGAVTPGMNAPLPGQFTPTPGMGTAGDGTSNQITEAGMALAVRDSDGCAQQVLSQVSAQAPRLYATARVRNALASTQVSVSWLVSGQVVYTNSAYTLPQDDPDFCLWFYIEPVDVSFAPGDWAVQFLLNGQPAGAPAPFTMTS